MKSNCGERDNASAIARCGASKIEMSCTAPMPIPVSLVNSAMTGFIGTKYGDQIIPLTSAFPAAFAAAIVCSSIVAAWAKGVVPGTKFATVSPTLPCRNVRREKLDLDMTSSSPVLALCVYLWGGPAERRSPYEILCHAVAQLRVPGIDNGRASVACMGQGTRKLSTGRSREEKLKGPPVTLAPRTLGFAAKAR